MREPAPDVTVEAAGVQESRRVVLNIEGSLFEFHPTEARAIGAALIAEAVEAEQRELAPVEETPAEQPASADHAQGGRRPGRARSPVGRREVKR